MDVTVETVASFNADRATRGKRNNPKASITTANWSSVAHVSSI